MLTNKNAQLRYKVLDRCFSDFHHKYNIEDPINKVNEALTSLYGTQVSIRQIREDIKYMRDRVTYNAPIKASPYDGRKSYYRYSNCKFSIFNNDLSTEEVASLRSTIDILSRFYGVSCNAWLEDVISNLEYQFNILYRTFTGKEQTSVIHPYHIKQFNNHWFLIGLQEDSHGNYITNKALDDEKEHIIKLMVRRNKELESRIFSYGNQVEILKPQWLRKRITEKLKRLLKKYSTVQKDCSIES
ncbi:helix-turn-helix transcriptional regulator [Phocaeicola sp.]